MSGAPPLRRKRRATDDRGAVATVKFALTNEVSMRNIGWWIGILAAGTAVACAHAPVETGTAPSPATTELVSAPTPSPSQNLVESAIQALPGWQPLNPPTAMSAGPNALENLIHQLPGWQPLDPSR